MVERQQAENWLGILKESTSVDELNQRFVEIFHHYSTDRFSIVKISTSQKVDFFETYPPEWISYYVKNKYYLIDPVFPWGKMILPFSWDIEAFDSLTLLQNQLFHQAHDYGVVKGTTIPLVLGQNDQSYLTILDTTNPHPEMVHALSFAGHIYWNVKSELQSKQSLSLLTRREYEVMVLKAQGKPIKVVAGNLAISEATVVFHLRNIRQKLNATSVEHALFLFGVAMSGTENGSDVSKDKSSFFNIPSYDQLASGRSIPLLR
ncbi:MAG: autoinducer binding domain-containing protein [Alphaproteobacteria bacterium]|nr:autoinducer binding domain-containing protein [Alphaproteobacteria bacterium]